MNISAVSTALQGLEANFSSLDRAAQQISSVAAAGGDAVDIAASLVAMMQASVGVEASISMIKAEYEAQQQIVDLFV